MPRLLKYHRVWIYFISEILPAFLLGVLVFISILLMFQALRLTEFVLVHGIKWTTMAKVMGYMSISFLPLLFPMSLLFAILISYNRFSIDSEIIALKSIGVNTLSLIAPALLLAFVVTFISAQTSYFLAPWGNQQFEVLITRLGNTKAAASIKEGTFSQSFFDMVVYANKVDSNNGLLHDLFIYDEKSSDVPLTIIAPLGQIIPDQENPGHSVLLRLSNGQIHRKADSHTIINFDSYDILLNDPIQLEERKKSASSLTFEELKSSMSNPVINPDLKKDYQIEYHKRSALAVACFIFALVGVAFGIVINRRNAKSSGFILSVGFIILYWIVYLSFESLVRSGKLPASIGIWLPNFLFLLVASVQIRKIWV